MEGSNRIVMLHAAGSVSSKFITISAAIDFDDSRIATGSCRVGSVRLPANFNQMRPVLAKPWPNLGQIIITTSYEPFFRLTTSAVISIYRLARYQGCRDTEQRLLNNVAQNQRDNHLYVDNTPSPTPPPTPPPSCFSLFSLYRMNHCQCVFNYCPLKNTSWVGKRID